MFKAAIDTFVSFSFLPIRAISFLGLLVSLLSFVFGFYVVINKLFFGTRVDGWTSVMLAVLVLGGVQLADDRRARRIPAGGFSTRRARVRCTSSNALSASRPGHVGPTRRGDAFGGHVTVTLRLPDFIIGGAPRSGTTWLYWLLDRHPEIYMASPVKPEPKFFLVDHLYEKGLRFYADTWFAARRRRAACRREEHRLSRERRGGRAHRARPAAA